MDSPGALLSLQGRWLIWDQTQQCLRMGCSQGVPACNAEAEEWPNSGYTQLYSPCLTFFKVGEHPSLASSIFLCISHGTQCQDSHTAGGVLCPDGEVFGAKSDHLSSEKV